MGPANAPRLSVFRAKSHHPDCERLDRGNLTGTILRLGWIFVYGVFTPCASIAKFLEKNDPATANN